MTKTIEQLEQEAKQAREEAIFFHGSESPLSQDIVDSFINAAVAMVTYQFALGMEEVKKEATSANFASVQNDGWIEWNGGECPVDCEKVEVKFNTDFFGSPFKESITGCAKNFDWDISLPYGRIISYRIAKQE